MSTGELIPHRWAKNALDGTGKTVGLWGLNLNADDEGIETWARREAVSGFPRRQRML
jgi:hypothetical protein